MSDKKQPALTREETIADKLADAMLLYGQPRSLELIRECYNLALDVVHLPATPAPVPDPVWDAEKAGMWTDEKVAAFGRWLSGLPRYGFYYYPNNEIVNQADMKTLIDKWKMIPHTKTK